MNTVLVLTFTKKRSGVASRVYRATLHYIAHAMKAEKRPFTTTRSLLQYCKSHTCSIVVTTNEISREAAALLKGLGVVQVVIGNSKHLHDLCDIIIDPLMAKDPVYLAGTKYLLSTMLQTIPARAIADHMKCSFDQLIDEVECNSAETALIDIIQVCQKLQWDSDFFGINIGYISCLRLTENVERFVRRFVRRYKIDMLEYLCNCHDRQSVLLSEKNGYSFVDIRLTFEKFLSDNIKLPQRNGYMIRKGTKRELQKLRQISKNMYRYSRYHFDENFDQKKIVEFYTGWLEKAILGTFDDFVYVLFHNKTPIGFCTIKKSKKKHTASIGLLGLSPAYTGRGLGRYMLDSSLYLLRKEEEISYLEVVTQGRNYEAQRLYQRCGFVTKKTELWYHKWFR